MSNSKKMLSLLMAVIMFILSAVSSTAIIAPEDSVSAQVQWIHKIDEALLDKMAQASSDEKIPVYVWYEDINQDEVDELTTKATGLTPESCSVIKDFPTNSLLNSLRNGDIEAESSIDAYMQQTKKIRETERELAERYSKKHLEISNDMYNEKSTYIKNSLSINDVDVEFCSQFAPMIITQMTKDEIEHAAKNENIEEISLYVEMEMVEESISSAITTTNIDKINFGTSLGLTGEDIAFGVIENNRVIFSTDGEEELQTLIQKQLEKGNQIDINTLDRIEIEQENPVIINTDNGGSIRDYGNVAVVEGTPNPITTHSTAVAKTILSVAPNVKIYCTNFNYENIETLISMGVKIFNMSLGVNVKETNSKYAYTDQEKWFDYIVANHGVTIFISAGNNGSSANDHFETVDGESKFFYGPRVISPGMAYNVITVGAYNDALAYMDSPNATGSVTTDTLYDYSSYLNKIGDKFGCEKPDVVMPATFNGGGTSMASPFLAGTVALICELKPSIQNKPQLIKAIVLASCHRKVEQSMALGGQETVVQGITERHGAGAPDAWIMASIICQGTYGVGEVFGSEAKINIAQPPYGAQHMNVSVAWLKENTVEEDLEYNIEPNDITDVLAQNINLYVYNSDNMAKSSTLTHSSTEMCYFPLSTTNFNYRFKLLNESSDLTKVRYAYAWSTDEMEVTPISSDGIYYLKNSANERYATYNTSSATPQTVMRSVTSQLAFSDTHMWILQKDENAAYLTTGYGETKLFLGYDDSASGTTIASQLSSVAFPLNIEYNENDGTVSVFNTSKSRILTYSGSNVVWKTFNSATSTISTNQKWYLEKVNYLISDANMDGAIGKALNDEFLDATAIRQYLVNKETFSNVQCYLADVDNDGEVSILDAFSITSTNDD